MKFVKSGILPLVLCTFLGFGKTCGPSEYPSAAGECCPMCNFGSVVLTDCSGDFSTTCKPCAPGTYMNQPNGLHKCFACRNCDESQGLYIQSRCTTISDTICNALDGYYCPMDSECSHAIKHSVCKPGQETKKQGTKTSDTVCVNCTKGFYSPFGIDCIKWTNCTIRNEIETDSGNSEKDVTCSPTPRERWGLIAAMVLTFVSVPLYLLQKSACHKLKRPVEETNSNT